MLRARTTAARNWAPSIDRLPAMRARSTRSFTRLLARTVPSTRSCTSSMAHSLSATWSATGKVRYKGRSRPSNSSGVSGGTRSGRPLIAVPTTTSTWNVANLGPRKATRSTRRPFASSCRGRTLVTSNRKWSPASRSSAASSDCTAASVSADRSAKYRSTSLLCRALPASLASRAPAPLSTHRSASSLEKHRASTRS